MKRSAHHLIAITALLTLILSAASSCGDSKEPSANPTGTNPSSSEAIETQPTETGEFADRKNLNYQIGDFDFNGETFTVCYTSEQMEEPYFAEQENGTVINDAVYKRERDIEEQFHVDITNYDVGGNFHEVAEAVRISTAAGAQAYDLTMTHTFAGLTGLMTAGYLYDWNDVPHIDMTQDWWNHNIADTLTIHDKLFANVNDLIYQRPIVIYFNKDMISSFDLENPYELVHNGTWTWEKLRSMGMAVAADLDGNGKYDEQDRYGYGVTLGWQAISVVQSCGIQITNTDENGMYNFDNLATDKMASIFDQYYDILYNSNHMFYNVVYTVEMGAVNGDTPLFKNGQLLFLHSNTELLPRFREISVNFGILPLPKYDEKQDGYYSMADTQMLIVPSDVKNLEMTGVITEALAYESYKNVVPAVYETMFANKYLRDEESYDMFNITRAGLVYEPLWTYGEGADLVYALPNMMSAQNKDLISYYDKRKKSTERTINRVIESIDKLS